MDHINKWLLQEAPLVTQNGDTIEVWKLQHAKDDEILSSWAKHFREHYCSDDLIDALRAGTPLTRKEYLEQLIFPDKSLAPGPSIRSGDFAELLSADYLEYILRHWVPRVRMDSKAVRNESIKGCDVIGFKFYKDGDFSPNDILTIFESKAHLTINRSANCLQNAVNDSGKDSIRKAEALNALKRRLIEKQRQLEADKIARFQNVEDKPYKEFSGAVAVLSSVNFLPPTLIDTDSSNHPNKSNLKLLVIYGESLMDFANELYNRAANEA